MQAFWNRKSRMLKYLHDKKAPFFAIDLETTGLDPKQDRIVSAGFLPFTRESIQASDGVAALVQHEKVTQSIAIHEVTPELAREGWTEKVLLQHIEPYLDHIWVGHYLDLDIGFLRAAFKRHQMQWKSPRVVDTLKLQLHLDRHIRHEQRLDAKAYTLEQLCERQGIPVQDSHTALGDALLAALLCQSLAKRLDQA